MGQREKGAGVIFGSAALKEGLNRDASKAALGRCDVMRNEELLSRQAIYLSSSEILPCTEDQALKDSGNTSQVRQERSVHILKR